MLHKKDKESRYPEDTPVPKGLICNEDVLKSIQESANKICIIDVKDGKILFANNPFKTIFKNCEGESCYQLFESRKTPCRFCEKLKQNHVSNPINTTEFYNKKIKDHWYHIFDLVIPWSDGRNVRYVVLSEATNPKFCQALSSDEKWRDQEKRILKVGRWRWVTKSDELFCSTEVYEILGVTSSGDVLNKNFFENFIHPDDRDLLLSASNEGWNENKVFHREYRIVRTDGTIRYIHEIYEKLFDDDHNLTECFGTFRDVTELKTAEMEIEQTEELIQTFYSSTPTMVVIFSGNETKSILEISNELCRKSGYLREELIGKSVLSFLTPKSLEYYHQVILKEFEETGSVENCEIQLKKKNNELLEVSLSGTLLINKKGKYNNCLITLEDITERKKAEKKLIDQQKEIGQKRIALKVLIEEYARSKNKVEQRIIEKIDQSVLPLLEKIIEEENADETVYNLKKVKESLLNIVKPLGTNHGYRIKLTPTEVKVADAIRNGLSSKEIAQSFNTTIQTVNFHRKNIRKKLGLSNNKINLGVYLSSME